MDVQATLLDLLEAAATQLTRLVIVQRDKIVKPGRAVTRKALFAGSKALGEEFAALPETLRVDPVPDSRRDVPLRGDIKCGERLRGVKQSLHGNELIRIAMNQQHRRSATNLGCERVHVDVLWHDEHARIADDSGRRD